MVQGVLAGLRPAVVAMIASAGVTLVNLSFFGADALPAGLADVDLIAVLLFAAALFVLRRWRARARRGLCCTRCCKALRPNGKNRPGRQNVRGGFCIVWQRNAAGTAGAGLSKNVQGSA